MIFFVKSIEIRNALTIIAEDECPATSTGNGRAVVTELLTSDR
jgi:hypothetical protein